MAANEEDLRQRLFRAQESFDTELKSWIDPTKEPGKATIAKACMALRNTNGGFLIIGIGDDGKCLNDQIPPEISKQYHPDVIQEIITKFSSEAFEIHVHFIEREGYPRVMIEVPMGVITPVHCRNDLPRSDSPSRKGGSLLRRNDIYVRTLTANGRVSTAIASASDWPRIMEVCFNNREADIGAFVRRQLSGLDSGKLIEGLQSAIAKVKGPTPPAILNTYLNEMEARFLKQCEERQPHPPKTGTRETAAIILGNMTPPVLNRNYMMQLLQVPHYSGWPPWIGLTNMQAPLGRVNYVDNGWESFEYITEPFQVLDFSRIDASGRFYYLEALRDDLVAQVKPGEHLEFVIETARVTEIIAVCLAFAKEFCGPDSPNDVGFAFRWRGLKGRRISSWASPGRNVYLREMADQDEFVTYATMPVATVADAIGPHVEAVVKRLFCLFKGMEFSTNVIQDIVTGRLKNRL